MLGNLARWTVGGVLVACWFGTLFERSYVDDQLRIDVDDESLFLGMSILLAGWMLAISLRGQESTRRLASDYVTFAEKIGNQNLTPDQLAKEAGERSTQSLEQNGQLHTKNELSSRQHRSLERLIYEGKICMQEGHYSLPPAARHK